jgi:hypothetical protein
MTVCCCGRVVILRCNRWTPQVDCCRGGIPFTVPGGRLVWMELLGISLIEKKSYDKESDGLVGCARVKDGIENVTCVCRCVCIQGVPRGKVNILGGHSIGHSKQITL